MSLGLDIHKLSKYSWVIKLKKAAKQCESLDGVSVSTTFAQSRHWDSDFSSLGLGLAIETQIFQSRSRQWDSDIFSLGLGLDDQNLVLLIPDFISGEDRTRPELTQP